MTDLNTLVKCDSPASCSLCDLCSRNAPVEHDEDIKIFKLTIAPNCAPECDGYVHKQQGSLF